MKSSINQTFEEGTSLNVQANKYVHIVYIQCQFTPLFLCPVTLSQLDLEHFEQINPINQVKASKIVQQSS